MTPLFKFETPGKEKFGTSLLIDRVERVLLPKMKAIGIKCVMHKMPELGDTNILVFTNGKQTVMAIPWVRPRNHRKTITQIVADYPRLNIVKEYRDYPDEEKIQQMFKLLKKYEMYFFVMLERQNDSDLYWLGRYTDIPMEYWKTTYRKKGAPLDRIHFPNYNTYNFVREKELKTNINKLLRNESK